MQEPSCPSFKAAVFLDRDGTINIDVPGGYTHRTEDLAFEEGAIEGLQKLSSLDCLLIITTGQSGIGRGIFSEEQYQEYMQHLLFALSDEGVSIDAIYHCPHHPTQAVGDYKVNCSCRKPKTGMIQEACQEMLEKGVQIDLANSFVVGDKTDDGQMGNDAGCRSILVRCPSGKQGEDGHYTCSWSFEAANLSVAAEWIEQQLKLRS